MLTNFGQKKKTKLYPLDLIKKKMELTEQQQHLKQLLEQREKFMNAAEYNKSMFLRASGAIEYLQEIGVTLPEQNATNIPEQETEAPTETE